VTILDPELSGRHVRLEPLQSRHAPGLAAAARQYVAVAEAAREAGTAAPFAVVRLADETVIGSTRLFDLERWAWPDGHPRHGHDGPDTCEIGHTWLAASAIRSGANTEMKRLMLTLAFDAWDVQSVCFHTDARNERSRRALARIGARYEGTLRSHQLGSDGRPRDSARFAITAADWPAVRAHLAELSRDSLLAS
jgi:RimJ/RimL family protein N-acetyltransferase